MSEFGLKIKNIEAATLYEYNKGIRDHYDYKDAMFVNSLFKDFICENGMEDWKNESTRDIICLEFNFGTRSYEQEIEHLSKIRKKANEELQAELESDGKSNITIQKIKDKLKKIDELEVMADKNELEYEKLSKEEIRQFYYNNGCDVEYITRKKNGKIIDQQIIHYKMLYRSTGKAKKGTCMFIKDSLYDKARDFLYMGIELPEKNAKIVEISAYAPLISSGIESRLIIEPENILILKDVDRSTIVNAISVETDENMRCVAKQIKDCKVTNTLFDGQALIDSSIFPEYANGYVLLRHHFCKMAAFNTNIQLFYKDYFGDNYETATVTDMFGNEHKAKDIKLITTDQAMKWLKFNITYEYWCKKVHENGCLFGIVKTAHPSKLGNVQKMSYQMVNSLDLDIMESVCDKSVEYIKKLKTDDNFFLEYLRKNTNFSNDYDVLLALVEHNPEFIRSSFFRERKRKIIMTYVLNFKSGKVIQNADNLVIVGSPYAMLLYGAACNPDIVDTDDTFSAEQDCIQCYTSRFEDGEYLAEFRSPFNGKYNMGYLKNCHNEKFKKYFNFCDQIIAVNMNGTCFQSRNNGSDQDSDSLYVTNQNDIVEYAKYCFKNYNTIVNNIENDKNTYSSSMNDFAKLDNKLAASQIAIGESSNLAQIAQTYDCTFGDQKYKDYVCILSVLAQIAIDSSKRLFNVDINAEISRIKKDMNVKENLYPKFWQTIRQEFNKENINEELKCPMNYLYDLKLDQFRSPTSTIEMKHFFIRHPIDCDKRQARRVEEMIEKYTDALRAYNRKSSDDANNYIDNDNNYLLLRSDFQDLVNDISQINISRNYKGLMAWLIDRAFSISPSVKRNNSTMKSVLRKNKSALIKVLYQVNKECFLSCFSQDVM